MEFSKKMMLVDPRFVNDYQPLIPKTENLRSDIHHILDSAEKDDRGKATAYQQALSKYLNAHRKIASEQSAPVKVEFALDKEPATYDEDTIISSLPKYSRTEAAKLLEQIKDKTVLSWDKKGRLLRDGSVVEGSNIEKLLAQAVAKKSSKSKPEGWNVFASELWPVDETPISDVETPKSSKSSSRKRKKRKKLNWENY
jgi:hypothetical protein